MVASFSSEDMDEVCNMDGTVPYRYAGEWVCGLLPEPQVYYNTTILVYNGTIGQTYVPYENATQDVDLNNKTLIVQNITLGNATIIWNGTNLIIMG